MNEHLWWYTARAGGMVSWALLAGSMLLGLATAARFRPGRVTAPWMVDLHRFLGGLSVLFVAVHVAGIVADGSTDFGVSAVLVPFASEWRPAAVAWGVVAMYLLLAVELTSLARRRLSRRWWRRLHQLSFPMFVLSAVHLWTSGTDTGVPLVAWTVAALCGATALTGALRLVQRPDRPRGPRGRPVGPVTSR